PLIARRRCAARGDGERDRLSERRYLADRLRQNGWRNRGSAAADGVITRVGNIEIVVHIHGDAQGQIESGRAPGSVGRTGASGETGQSRDFSELRNFPNCAVEGVSDVEVPRAIYTNAGWPIEPRGRSYAIRNAS